jgi:hypothetical protein
VKGRVVVVTVDVVTQPPPSQASQQLGRAPEQEPPRAVQRAALDAMPHVVPFGVVRQQATAPGLPHVDRDAHRATWPAHCRGSWFAATRPRTTALAQATHAPWLTAVEQSHATAMASRASATAVASPGLDPHGTAPATVAKARSVTASSTRRMRNSPGIRTYGGTLHRVNPDLVTPDATGDPIPSVAW